MFFSHRSNFPRRRQRPAGSKDPAGRRRPFRQRRGRPPHPGGCYAFAARSARALRSGLSFAGPPPRRRRAETGGQRFPESLRVSRASSYRLRSLRGLRPRFPRESWSPPRTEPATARVRRAVLPWRVNRACLPSDLASPQIARDGHYPSMPRRQEASLWLPRTDPELLIQPDSAWESCQAQTHLVRPAAAMSPVPRPQTSLARYDATMKRR